jgi:hypothetical protein
VSITSEPALPTAEPEESILGRRYDGRPGGTGSTSFVVTALGAVHREAKEQGTK